MDAWPRCRERLEAELPVEGVQTWLKPLQARLRDDGMVLYAPNAFVRDAVQARYLNRISELLGHYAGNAAVSLEIGSVVRPAATAPSPTQTLAARTPVAEFAGNLDNHYTFDINGPWAPHNFVELNLKA